MAEDNGNMFFADRVAEKSSDTGLGPLALHGAMPGFRRFADAVPQGAQFSYAVHNETLKTEWETGIGHLLVEGDQTVRLQRAPSQSSAGSAGCAFSAGLKIIALTLNAEWLTAQQQRGFVAPPGSLTQLAQGGMVMRSASELPSAYPLGWSAAQADTSFPVTGMLVTFRNDDKVIQRLSSDDPAAFSEPYMRLGHGEIWRSWSGVRHSPLLQNGWGEHAAWTANPAYYRDASGRVHLEGNIAGGSTDNNTVLFNLPPEFRPQFYEYFTVREGVTTDVVGLYVNASGNVVLQSRSPEWLSLSGISFLAAL